MDAEFLPPDDIDDDDDTTTAAGIILPPTLTAAMDRLESAFGGGGGGASSRDSRISVARVNSVPDRPLRAVLKRYVRRVALALYGDFEGTSLSLFGRQVPRVACRHEARGRIVTASVTVDWDGSALPWPTRGNIANNNNNKEGPQAFAPNTLVEIGAFLVALLQYGGLPETVSAQGLRVCRRHGHRFHLLDLNPATGEPSTGGIRQGIRRPRGAKPAVATRGPRSILFSVTLTLSRCVGSQSHKRKRAPPRPMSTDTTTTVATDNNNNPKPRKRMRRAPPDLRQQPQQPLILSYDADSEPGTTTGDEGDLYGTVPMGMIVDSGGGGGSVRATDSEFWFADDADDDADDGDSSRALSGFPRGTPQRASQYVIERLAMIDDLARTRERERDRLAIAAAPGPRASA